MTDKKESIVLFEPKDPSSKPFNKTIYGFDTETEGSKNTLTIATFVNEDEVVTCYSFEEVIDFLNKHPKIVCIATMLSFDFYSVFAEYKDNWDILQRDGRLLKASYYPNGNKKDRIDFYDTMCYMPSSVAYLGKLVGIKKMDHPSCFNKHPQNEKEYKELIDYCANDSLISYTFFKKFIIKFIDEYGLKLGPTMPSIAMNLFQTKYLNETIEIKPENHDFIRRAYYGGRVEIFRRGVFEKVNYYDFNSLYPSIMSECLLPVPKTEQVMDKADLNVIMKYEGFTHIISGYQPYVYIPVLPFRNPLDNDKLIFPVGEIRDVVISNCEIREAIKLGFQIKELGKSVYYLECKPYLQQYANDLYKLRKKYKDSKNDMELCIKLALNSLYGKFGINWKESKSLIPKNQFLEMETKNIIRSEEYIYFGNSYYSVYEVNDKPLCYALIMWAAQITAKARLKLFSVLNNVEVQKHLIYCDTDSLFLDNDYKLPNSKELGELKLENEHGPYKESIFIRPKVYMKDNEVKWKGFKIKDVLNDDGTIKKNKSMVFMELLTAKDRTEERFARIKVAVKTLPHHKLSGIKVNERYDVTKKVNLEDTKREWNNLKFNVKEIQKSKPIEITKDYFKKKVKITEKQLMKAYTQQRYEDLISSDEFDINAVGKDIDPMEYLNNEMSKEFF